MIRPTGPTDPAEIGGYHVEGVLGDGGMGRVYLCRASAGDLVAVKVVRPEFAADPTFRKRFQQEVATAQQVQGPHTVPVLDADPAADQPWLATEYVPGQSVQQRVEQFGPMAVHEVLALVTGVAQALQSIHAAGVVHRDLKPSNVILAADGPRVIDFGIARAVDVTSVTATGVTPGTPAYMAPEYIRGQQVTSAVDIFALGVLANYAATGRLAFGSGVTMAVSYRILEQRPDLTGCPKPLRAIVERCLDKNPVRRPSPADLVRAFRDAQTIAAAPATAPPPPRRRNRIALISTGVVVLVLAVAAVIVVPGLLEPPATSSQDPPPAATSTPATSAPVQVVCGGKQQLTAAGSAVQNSAMNVFTEVYGKRCAGAGATYQAVGAGAATQSFAAGQVDLAGVDAELREADDGQARARCAGNPVWHLPLAINPLAVAYRLDGVADLTLTGEIAAKIFNGSIRTWDDPAIKALNNSVTLPSLPIQVIYLGSPSGATIVFQSYLRASSKGAWTTDTGDTFTGGVGTGVNNSNTMAQAIGSQDGAIGYLAWQTATSAALRAVKLDGADLTEQTVSAAITATPVAEGNNLVINLDQLYSTTPSGGYPLVRVVYEVVCSKGYDQPTAAAVKAFLTTAATDGQQEIAGEGYVPLPAGLRTKVLTAISAIS